MNRTITRILALNLCLLCLFSFVPLCHAHADGAFPENVTIQSEKNNAFDYLEYYSGGKWKDLNTPRHWIEQTGQVCYCIEHSSGNPHSASYTATPPSSVFGSNTLAGLQTILMYGYPCNTPDGFTEDEARQATANAIRFWLSENGEPGSYSFTNRRAHPNQIRAKLGYEHVLEWADELLQMARDKQTLNHAIEFTPSALTLDRSGTGYSGTTTVQLTNINSGYTLDTSGLPAGVTLTGFTGRQSETLTITAPLTAAGQTFSITATGKDTRALENMTAYIPSKDSLQKIFLCANTAQVVASASFGVNTPAAGKLQVKKYGDNNAPLAGVKFGVYSDAACTTKITEVTTGMDGTVLLDNMNGGTYYVKELSTVRPYVIDGMVNTVIVKASETTTLEVQNETAKGVIRVKKTGEALVGTTVTSTEYGQLHTPKYQNGGLAGCEFTVKNESGTVVATLTTDADGIAETGLLPFGTYTVQETKAPAGYELDPSVQTVTLAYKDQNTPIVYGEVTAINNRIPTSVKIVKRTDHFNKQTMKFEAGPLEGAVFGLYTAEAIGVIPKNTMVDLLTTDASGMATSSATLPFGKYYLRELKLPDNTIHLSEESYPLTVKGHNKVYVDEPIWNDRFVGNVAIWKGDDTEGGRMLEGAEYEVRDADGLLYCTMVTDRTGYAVSCDLPVGTYYVREIIPPAGFILSDEITDEPICLQIDKVDLFTGEPFPLVEFQLRNMDDQVIRTILVDQIREVGGLRSVVVSNNNDYRIWAKDGEDFFHVGDDGHVEFRYLPAGEYKLVEVPPTGYIAEDEISVVLTDRNGVSNPKMVRVENRPTGIKLQKIDSSSGNPLMGAGFEIKVKTDSGFESLKFVKNSDGSFFYDPQGNVTELMVDGMGEITLYGVPLGDIWVEETTVPDGYFPISAQQLTVTKEMSNDAPYVMTIKNHRFVKLGMNSDWWEFPALCGGVLLLMAGGVVAIIRIRKKHSYR